MLNIKSFSPIQKIISTMTIEKQGQQFL